MTSVFTIVDGNVYAKITNTGYRVEATAFSGVTQLTKVVESAGYLNEAQYDAFKNSGLTSISCVGLATSGSGMLYGCTGLDYDNINLPLMSSIGGSDARAIEQPVRIAPASTRCSFCI